MEISALFDWVVLRIFLSSSTGRSSCGKRTKAQVTCDLAGTALEFRLMPDGEFDERVTTL